MNENALFLTEALICRICFYTIPFVGKKKDILRTCISALLMILSDFLMARILPGFMREYIFPPVVSSAWFNHLSKLYNKAFGAWLIDDILVIDHILARLVWLAAACIILAKVRKLKMKNAVYCASLVGMWQYLCEAMIYILGFVWFPRILLNNTVRIVSATVLIVILMTLLLRKTFMSFHLLTFDETGGIVFVIVCLMLVTDRVSAALTLTNDLRHAVSLLFLLIMFLILTDSRTKMKNSIARQVHTESMLETMKYELEQMKHTDLQTLTMKHDMLHHLQIIKRFHDSHDEKGAEIYIQSAIAEFTETKSYAKTYNQYLNALLVYLQNHHPEIDFETVCMLGEDCPAEEIDIALLVLCMADAQIRNVSGKENDTLRIELKQVEQDVAVIVSFQQNDRHAEFTETENSILNRILNKYNGECIYDEKYKGDISVFLHCQINSIPTC